MYFINFAYIQQTILLNGSWFGSSYAGTLVSPSGSPSLCFRPRSPAFGGNHARLPAGRLGLKTACFKPNQTKLHLDLPA